MRASGLAVIVVVAACGRVRFDELGDAPGPGGDGGDAANACAFTFCDDFDRPAPLEATWDALANTGNATLAFDPDSTSAPQSYRVTLPGLDGGFLEKSFPATTTSARIAFAISYTSDAPGTAEVDLVQLQWTALPVPCTSFGYYLIRDGTGPFDLQETYGGCGGNVDTPLVGLDNTGWHSVEMLVTFGAVGTARVQVMLDGILKIDQPAAHEIPASALKLRLGAGASRNVTTPWDVRYDDVIVELK